MKEKRPFGIELIPCEAAGSDIYLVPPRRYDSRTEKWEPLDEWAKRCVVIKNVAYTVADAQEPVITVDPAQDFQVMYDNDGNYTAITATDAVLSNDPITESHKWLAGVGTRNFVVDTSTVHPGAPTRLDFSIDLAAIPGSGWFTRVDVQCRVRATYETDAITGPWSEACKFWLFRAWSMAAAIHIP